ncbi:MAG: hypothetical protein HQL07_08945 [Nitrospirae bacterium]|nr:hypothetical protein [Magnetococcales bacterium]HAT50587.1 hypothetical protein [Alphaproteobacteria bacterium]
MVDGQENPQDARQPVGSEDGVAQTAPVDSTLVRRRQLLKGIAAGVPAIVTLQSGAALAASSITPQCTINGPDFSAQPRCVTSGVAATSRWVYKADNASDPAVWGAGNDGPCTAAQYGAVYVDNDGIYTTSTPWGGTTVAGQPASGYYAITNTCWSSFYWP